MSIEALLPWLHLPLYDAKHRAYSFKGAIEYGFTPWLYRPVRHTQTMRAEALLDFKIWGKRPCLTCYFRNIRTSEKFCLTAFDNTHDGRYTSCDNDIDFSAPDVEGGLYLVTTGRTKKGRSAWQSAKLLLAPDRNGDIWLRVATTYIGPV